MAPRDPSLHNVILASEDDQLKLQKRTRNSKPTLTLKFGSVPIEFHVCGLYCDELFKTANAVFAVSFVFKSRALVTTSPSRGESGPECD